MIPIKDLITAPDEILDFIEDYIDSIKSFRFTIETYKIERNILAIRNMDLWIESYIDIIPELQEFRDFVWKEMERLGIERHPDYVYDKDFNHFYCNNKRSIESLRELRDRLFNNEIEITRCVNHDKDTPPPLSAGTTSVTVPGRKDTRSILQGGQYIGRRRLTEILKPPSESTASMSN